MERLRVDFEKMQGSCEALGPEDWTGLMVTHAYMGPVPAFFYAAGQLMDYGVHSWDIRRDQRSRPRAVRRGSRPARAVHVRDLAGHRPCRDRDRAVHDRHPGHRPERRRLPGLGQRRRPDLRDRARSRACRRYLEFDAASLVLRRSAGSTAGTVRGDDRARRPVPQPVLQHLAPITRARPAVVLGLGVVLVGGCPRGGGAWPLGRSGCAGGRPTACQNRGP